jgi:hypothetical protein
MVTPKPETTPKKEFPWFLLFTSFFGFGSSGYGLGSAMAEESFKPIIATYKGTIEAQAESLSDLRKVCGVCSDRLDQERKLCDEQHELLKALWKRDYGTPGLVRDAAFH